MPEPLTERGVVEDGRRIVITGAGGWIGRATLDLLADALGDNLPKRVACFGSGTREVQVKGGHRLMIRPLADMAWLPRQPSLVLHTAFLTKDRAEVMSDEAYRAANGLITRTVYDALGPIGAEAVFVASSGAALRADDVQASPSMRLYGQMKRDEEDVFAAWAQEHGKTAVIARIFALTGAHINKPEAYAIASFILDALAGRPVVVRAPHRVVRGYVAIRELMTLVLALMQGPPGVTRFETGGTPLELAEVAAHVARAVGGTVQRAPIASDRADIYYGNDPAYRALLAAHGITPMPLDRQIAEMVEWFSSAPAAGPDATV